VSDKSDYYTLLGVARGANQDDIKKAFRKQALKYHPDRNQDPGAESQFKAINEAYGVLSDESRRARYDQFGHAGMGATSQGYTGSAADYEDIFGADLFETLFSGLFRTSKVSHGQDISVQAQVSLECIATGGELDVTYRRLSSCMPCAGSGCQPGTQPSSCQMCGGVGQVRGSGFFSLPRPCDRCGGRGTIIHSPCAQCQGAGRVKSPATLRVPIPLGMNSGHRLRVDGEGHEGVHGGQDGDLYITVSQKPHKRFTRDGADLHCAVPISFPTAALGGQVSAPTLDEPVKIKVPEGSQSGKVLRVKNRGLPHLNGADKGHLYVKLAVDTPQKLSTSQKRLLEAFEDSLSNHDTATESNQSDGGVLSWLGKLF
jgi:molecular chaperone DnaJ